MIITVLFVSGGIYFFVQRALVLQIETHLKKDFATIVEYLKHDRTSLAKVADHGPILLFRVVEGNQALAVSDEWHSENLDHIIPANSSNAPHISTIIKNGKRYRVLIGTIELETHTYQVAVAHGEESVHQTLNTLALIILLILPMAVAISLAIGYAIAGRVLAPISAITRKAEEIGAENLSERLPVGEGDDEFSRLASVFNQTFARIEDSFGKLRRFTADASHELRTPLAAIRSIGETALHTPEDQMNSREAISSILEESDRLRQLVDALLVLSRADSGGTNLRREPVDLAALAHETAEFLGVLAEEKHQAIKCVEIAHVTAMIDRASVRQALTNLLDNAIKYAPPGSDINITIGATPTDEAFVEIADYGAGIPEADLQRIFDRFYRVDKGRSRELGGAGLGLAITKWAVESNGGRIDVVSTLGHGSLFRVIFPNNHDVPFKGG